MLDNCYPVDNPATIHSSRVQVPCYVHKYTGVLEQPVVMAHGHAVTLDQAVVSVLPGWRVNDQAH